MKLWLVFAVGLGLAGVGARAEEKPVRAGYYYTVRWGFQQEFERLFFKNHYPILKAQKERIKDVSVYRPTFHGDGRADWTLLVVITFASQEAFSASVDEDAIARRLYPDFETYKKEEQRRFELLQAHWDVPLTPISPPQ